jgi:hypothetical protein
MSCSEPPHEFTGTELCTPLQQIKLLPPTGEFVHPGEHEKIQKHKEAEKRRNEEERRRHEREHERSVEEAEHMHYESPPPEPPAEPRQKHEERMHEKYPPHPDDDADWSKYLDVGHEVVLPKKKVELPPGPRLPERKCSICGRHTTDYRVWSGSQCQCNSCRGVR